MSRKPSHNARNKKAGTPRSRACRTSKPDRAGASADANTPPDIHEGCDATDIEGTFGADPTERTSLALIRDLREGRRSGLMLGVDDRRRVVEHLTAEGYSSAEIAEVLKIGERTVCRDRAAVRELNAIVPRDSMLPEVVGQLLRTAEQVTGRLRRISREAGIKPADRIEAEKAIWAVSRECVVSLQGLGYLPTAPTQVMAHVSGDGGGMADVLAEIERLAALPALSAADGTPIVAPALVELQRTLGQTHPTEGVASTSRRDAQVAAEGGDS